jgi:DNA-binding response OmpR family regulator
VQVLIAEDDAISRKLLEVNLSRAGYSVVAVADGEQAWDALQADGAPKLAILDWMMPVMDGVEVCRRVRSDQRPGYIYLILLTAKSRQEDRAEGFQAGADDYLTKPFDVQELRARIAVGQRIIELQCVLEARVEQLREARGHVKQLQGLLPICMYCKKIRDDASTWHQLEAYIEQHSDAAFTHSLCADCMTEHYPNLRVTSAKERR